MLSMPRIFLLAVSCIFLFRAENSYAPIPPEAYGLPKASPVRKRVDQGLEDWFRKYSDAKFPRSVSHSEFNQWVTKVSKSKVERLMLKMHYYRDRSAQRKRFIPKAMRELEQLFQDDQFVGDDPMMLPWLLGEFLAYRKLDDKTKKRVIELTELYGGTTCSSKRALRKKLSLMSEEKKWDRSKYEAILNQVLSFHSTDYKKKVIKQVLRDLPEDQQTYVRGLISGEVSSYPLVLEKYPWLQDGDEKEIEDLFDPMEEKFISVTKNIKRGRCAGAKKYLIEALKIDVEGKNFTRFKSHAIKVSHCFRRRGQKKLIGFWKGVEHKLQTTYGFDGLELSLRSQGHTYWGNDQFEKAIPIFKDLLVRAKTGGFAEIEARTIYTIGNIKENQGYLVDATKFYQEYVEKFPAAEHRDSALMSLVMLNVAVNQRDLAYKFVQDMIAAETTKAIDDRSTKLHSFALFWGGRIHFERGELLEAEELWRRVASEYYSTFYGAVGHYVLEKLLNYRIALQPSRAQPFNEKRVFAVFNSESLDRISSIKRLLVLGLKSQASCEVSELDMKDQPSRKLAVALLLHAGGSWLKSIQTYSQIPRSHRHSFPLGTEKILFPRAYIDKIEKYAKKLRTDADYIYAIIRQESVFNPSALSPAGARGLMQLMPGTARYEGRSLRRTYIKGSLRKKVIRQSRSKRKLHEADTNIILGVHHVSRLMNRYNSPIFVLTAYNASPNATKRWREKIKTRDVMTFIERIPYRETRSYVKLVLRNYFYYKRWYTGPEEKMPYLDILAPGRLATKEFTGQSKKM